MLIFDTGADDSDFGEMICHWDEDAALMYVRRAIEQAYRMFDKGLKQIDPSSGLNETEMQRELDEWSVKALALFEEYASEAFFVAQGRLVSDVVLKLAEEAVGQIKIHPVCDGQELDPYSIAELEEMRAFKEVRKNLSEFFKTRHNKIIGIHRGRQAQASVEKIIECLRLLPKRRRTLAGLETEFGMKARTIQYTLKAAGLTFAAAKKKAQE